MVWTKEKTEVPGIILQGQGSYGFEHRFHCTSHVPYPSFNRCHSFNSGLDITVSFKPGALSEDDALLIALELGSSWKMLGRALKVPDVVMDYIEADESEGSARCYRKCNCVVCI